MSEVSTVRLYLLRAMYLLIAVGMGMNVWPLIVSPPTLIANSSTVIWALFGGLTLMCMLGVRYPLQMLPVLMFELAWKVIWVVAFALPMWMGPGLDAYAAETLFATGLGVVLVPLVLPWGYVVRRYVKAPAAPWGKVNVAPAGNHAT